MKLLSTLLIMLPLAALAQPQITAGNMPQAGDVYSYGISYADFDPAEMDSNTGANYTWDFSTFTADDDIVQSVVAASSTPFTATFPTANLALVSNEVEYSFFTTSASSLVSNGIAYGGVDENVAIVYTDPELLCNLPFNHQSSFTDDFGGNTTIQGFDVIIDGDVTFAGDGYGTLILPSGTYPNCVRYRSTKTETLTFFGIPSITIINTWVWFSADHRYIVANFEEFVSTDGEISESTYTTFVRSAGPTSVEAAPSSSTFSIYPNPVQAGGTIGLDWHKTESVELALLNLAGQTVFTERVALTAGRNSLNLALAAQPAGVYFMRVVDTQGAASVQRLVIR